VEEEISNSVHATQIKNAFAATMPRKRINPVDDQIYQLQQQAYNDELEEQQYQQHLQYLLEEYNDIFDTETTTPANVPEVHIDLKPEYVGFPDPNRTEQIQPNRANPAEARN
jgi:hypothetical protein